MALAPKPKKKRNQEDTKGKLLKAALDVFSKVGYDVATTRNIAKKAGVNESLIHRYFESKLGLFFNLKEQFRENLINQFLADEECENLEDELVNFIKSRLHYTQRDKKFFKLSITRAILDPKLRDDVRKSASLKPPALIERFERFRRKGQIRVDIELDQMLGVLHSLAFGFSILLDAIECLEDEEVENLVKTAARILANGLAPKK
jgi:AcrR family transcriptional regulator